MNSANPVNGATYLTLGILSLVVCAFLGPLAWSMSNNALKVLDDYEMQTGIRALQAAKASRDGARWGQ